MTFISWWEKTKYALQGNSRPRQVKVISVVGSVTVLHSLKMTPAIKKKIEDPGPRHSRF